MKNLKILLLFLYLLMGTHSTSYGDCQGLTGVAEDVCIGVTKGKLFSYSNECETLSGFRKNFCFGMFGLKDACNNLNGTHKEICKAMHEFISSSNKNLCLEMSGFSEVVCMALHRLFYPRNNKACSGIDSDTIYQICLGFQGAFSK